MANSDKEANGTIKELKHNATKLGKEVENLKAKLDEKSKAVDSAESKKNRLEGELQ